VTVQEGLALRIDFSVNLLSNILVLLLLSVLLYCALQTISVIRWCIFWIAAGSVLTLIFTPSSKPEMFMPQDFTTGGTAGLIGGLVVACCIINVVLWFAYLRWYPNAVRKGHCCLDDLDWFFVIRPSTKPGHYDYSIPLPFPFWFQCFARDRTFGYEGEIDNE